MTSTTIEKLPVVMTMTVDPALANGWKTILFNCNCHTFEIVISTLVDALTCTYETALHLAELADQTGSAVVCSGSKDYCESVAKKIGAVGLVTTVTE